MVFFNYATMQMAAKIVYYGPGLCGKTTNLHHIYAKTSPQSRGEMVSLETETDRTLFFDLLPIDVGVIGGFKTRLQLYTVPGQVFYNTTRKLVLKGADGIVFVADSQKAMLDANVDSLKNLRENLAEIGLNLDELAVVLQLNKRDLPNIATPEEMLDKLDPERRHEYVEAAAVTGAGVFETLKTISKLTLRTLRRRMMGEDAASSPQKSAPVFLVNSQAAEPKAPTPSEIQSHIPAAIIENPTNQTRTTAVASASEAEQVEMVTPDMEVAPTVEPAAAEAPEERIDADIIADAPIAEPPVGRADAELSEQRVEESFATLGTEPSWAAQPAAEHSQPQFADQELAIEDLRDDERPVKAAPEVKHVKVRSSIDIMAELELLRKSATSSSPRKKETAAADAGAARGRKDIVRNLSMSANRGVVEGAQRVRVAVTFEDASGALLHTDESSVDVDSLSDTDSLQVNLKLDLGSGQPN